jgi:hypothetical protein
MPCQYQPSWLDHSNFIWQKVQVMKFLIMQFAPTFYYFFPIKPCSQTHSLPPLKSEPKFYTHAKLKAELYFLYILIRKILLQILLA